MKQDCLPETRRLLRPLVLLTELVSLAALAAACSAGDPAESPPAEPGAPRPHAEPIGSIQQALAGVDGNRTVASANTILNQYTTLAANAAANATSIQVSSVAQLADGDDPFLPGDLLLIVQMQGAVLNTAADSSAWGQVTDLGGAGLFEFVEVSSVDAVTNNVGLSCALKNAYSTAGNVQVIRVPQYDTLTIEAGASVTAPAWNGETGGVVAVHAQTTLVLEGAIDVSALGFRGGPTDNSSGASGTSVAIYASANAADGARKGEGIGGFPVQYGRAPAANGGGGGNSHNAGGGGGANARVGGAWTGQGVFDLSVQGGALAWLLDPNSSATGSEGGGRGGYTYSNSNQNATLLPPGDKAWGGNLRRERGGLGGRPVDNDPSARLFLGGGGGAGDGNNQHAGRGGNGGGLVIVLSGSVTGSGQILANGENGVNANSVITTPPNGDAPGGGGAGGSVVVRGTLSGSISVQARGGAGGDQIIDNGSEAEGPGGGGGGGYVLLSSELSVQVPGGPGGVTSSPALAEFPANGATSGSGGVALFGLPGLADIPYCVDTAAPETSILSGPQNPTSNDTGSFVFGSDDPNATFECRVGTASFAACPTNFTTAALADGSYTLEVRARDVVGNLDPTPASFTWVVDTAPPNTSILTQPDNPTNATSGAFTFGSDENNVTFECSLNGATFTPCPASYSTGALASGSHTLEVRARDAAGNVDATPASATWVIDTLAPDTTIVQQPDNLTNDPIGNFVFGSSDTSATFECRLGTAAFTPCPSSYTTPALSDGSQTLEVRARDTAGNVDATPASFTWVIDTTPPDTTIVLAPNNPTTSTLGSFTFTSDDAGATFQCSLNGSAFDTCTAPYSTGMLNVGVQNFQVRALDAAGNLDPTPASYSWTVVFDGGEPPGDGGAGGAAGDGGAAGSAGQGGAAGGAGLGGTAGDGAAGASAGDAGSDSGGAGEGGMDGSGAGAGGGAGMIGDAGAGPGTSGSGGGSGTAGAGGTVGGGAGAPSGGAGASGGTGGAGGTASPDDEDTVVLGGGLCAFRPAAPSSGLGALVFAALAWMARLRRRRPS